MTQEFNVKYRMKKTLGQILSTLKNHRITSGRTGYFEKGHAPFNAGSIGLTKANLTSFKKGNTPKNRKPVGSERIDSRGGYILIKIAERDPYTRYRTRYKLKHVHIWEQAHGPVSKGKILTFKDGNKLNCTVENLILVSRREALRLNQKHYARMPNELKPSVLALAKLEVKIFSFKDRR